MAEPETDDAGDEPLPLHNGDPRGATVWRDRQELARLNAATVFVKSRDYLATWLAACGLRLGAVLYPLPLSLGREMARDQNNASLLFGRIWPFAQDKEQPELDIVTGRHVDTAGSTVRVTEEAVREMLECFVSYLETGRGPGHPDVEPHETWATILRARRLQPWISVALAWWQDSRFPTHPVRVCLTFRATTDTEMAQARGHEAVLFCGD